MVFLKIVGINLPISLFVLLFYVSYNLCLVKHSEIFHTGDFAQPTLVNFSQLSAIFIYYCSEYSVILKFLPTF